MPVVGAPVTGLVADKLISKYSTIVVVTLLKSFFHLAMWRALDFGFQGGLVCVARNKLDGAELHGAKLFQRNCQNVPGAAGAAAGAAAASAAASAACIHDGVLGGRFAPP